MTLRCDDRVDKVVPVDIFCGPQLLVEFLVAEPLGLGVTVQLGNLLAELINDAQQDGANEAPGPCLGRGVVELE